MFVSAGVTPRSHNIASSAVSNRIIYASGQFLAVERVPSVHFFFIQLVSIFQTSSECGQVEFLSECRHTKPITVIKRAKGPKDCEIFVSGGSDGRINLWRLEETTLKHLFALGSLSV